MAEVRWQADQFIVTTEFWDNQRAKDMPKRVWDKGIKAWRAPPTKPNAMYLLGTFELDEFTPEAQLKAEALLPRDKREPFPTDYEFKLPAMEHQMQGLNDAWDSEAHALFFDMRLGKTFTALNLAFARYQHGQIERLLVVCPTPIKQVWYNEIDKFVPTDLPIDVHILQSGGAKQIESWMRGHDNAHLQILVIGVEALSQGGAYAVARQFCIGGVPTMMVIDESSRIKNFKSARTEKCILLGGRCEYRLILTGTPVTQGIHDLFSQFEFLHNDIIGQKSFYTFRNRYMIMGGFEGRQIMGYRNAKELMQLVEPYSTVVKTKDVYDLVEVPPQIRTIKPTPEQKKHFIELKHLMRTELEDGTELEAKTMLERMTRFQQINGGNFPYPNGEDNKGKTIWDTKPMKSNPKLTELESMLDELGDSQVIIWARFIPEILAIEAMLHKNCKTCVTFYGATTHEDREINRVEFQRHNTQFFIGNQATGGMGIELSEADVMVSYSNTFSYEDKRQSGARSDKIGKETACLKIDLVLDTPIDRAIMLAQEKKGGMARYVDDHLQELKRELE